MADRNKFEEMLERLINEDKQGAEELFHEIVVEKSRDIYESLLEDDLEEVANEEDEEIEEAAEEDEDEDEEMDEGFDLDEFEVEADDDMGGDPADDMMGDIEADMDDMDGDDEDEGEDDDMEDRVDDLEDALDDLKAEFEKMMAGEEADDEEADDEGADDEEADDMDMDMDADDEETNKSEGEQMREYVEKVTAKMGDNGANTKSTVAGANNMGGDASNLVQGGEEAGRNADAAKENDMGNVNVPGGKASKSMKAMPKGHGAEKKSAGETADNKNSVVGK